MADDRCYVLWCSEDGIRGSWYSKERLVNHLNEDYWGDSVEFLSELPEISDGYFREHRMDAGVQLVIVCDGKVVVPQKKAVKVAWSL